MFKKNKRREKSTYLSIENGEVVETKLPTPQNNTIHARSFDDFSDEELAMEDPEIKDGLPVCPPSVEEDEDSQTVEDMKATVFNIFKFIFIFCIIAIIAFILFRVGPVVTDKVSEVYSNTKSTASSSSNSSNSSSSNSSTSSTNVDSMSFLEKQQYEKEKKKLVNTMNDMNDINDKFETDWTTLQNYCSGYSNNSYTIYAHDKNMEALATQFSNEYLEFLNTEEDFETDYDKQLFEIYKKRYDNLTACMETLKDSSSYNRSTIIDYLNQYILTDNQYNTQEYDLLIENLNTYNMDYSITDTEIILN